MYDLRSSVSSRQALHASQQVHAQQLPRQIAEQLRTHKRQDDKGREEDLGGRGRAEVVEIQRVDFRVGIARIRGIRTWMMSCFMFREVWLRRVVSASVDKQLGLESTRHPLLLEHMHSTEHASLGYTISLSSNKWEDLVMDSPNLEVSRRILFRP
jgi:hypothetical protein